MNHINKNKLIVDLNGREAETHRTHGRGVTAVDDD